MKTNLLIWCCGLDLYSTFTPSLPFEFSNDGNVRDQNGMVIASTGGHEARAELVGIALNLLFDTLRKNDED